MCVCIGKKPMHTIAASTFLARMSALEKNPVQHYLKNFFSVKLTLE